MDRESAIERLRGQARQERADATQLGRTHGAEFVFNAASYQIVRELVRLKDAPRGPWEPSIDRRLWEALGDYADWHRDVVVDLDLPTVAYAEAFIEGAVDTWTEIEDEVEEEED